MTTLDRVAEQDAYLQGAIPDTYTCSQCGSHGCKLWRQYQTFADEIALLCLTCAEKDQNSFCKYSAQAAEVIRKWEEMWRTYAVGNSMSLDTQEKRDLSELHRRATSDQIGGLVPAVPTEDGTTFWGYTSIPSKGVTWWKKLPLRIQRTR